MRLILLLSLLMIPSLGRANSCSSVVGKTTPLISPAEVQLFHLQRLRVLILQVLDIPSGDISKVQNEAIQALQNSVSGFPLSSEQENLIQTLKVLFEKSTVHLPFNALQIVAAKRTAESDRPENWKDIQYTFESAVQLHFINEFALQNRLRKNPYDPDGPEPIRKYYWSMRRLAPNGDPFTLLGIALKSPHDAI